MPIEQNSEIESVCVKIEDKHGYVAVADAADAAIDLETQDPLEIFEDGFSLGEHMKGKSGYYVGCGDGIVVFIGTASEILERLDEVLEKAASDDRIEDDGE
jgi:hypothetical protein